MGFRKKNAKRSDNRSSAKVIMGKPASKLTKEEKKILSARMAEIRSENGGKSTVQNTIPYLCMYQDGVCQVSENFFSLTVQFYDANYSIAEFEEQNNIFSKYCDIINLFDNTIKFQLTFENQNRSKAKLVKTVQIPEQDDDFNAIRKEYSEMLTDKLLKGSSDKMEIEPYRELTTFPALLRTAMLEHNPDKPVEIMDFQRTFETPLDKAKFLINDFCEAEYRESADFDDLHNVGLVFTTLTDDELPIQVTADLVDFKITYEFDGEVYNTEQYDSIEDMIENGLTGLDFSDLISVPDEA